VGKEDVVVYKELDDGQLLTVDEVAEWLRLKKPHVYRLARKGVLHRVYLGARYVRIPAGAVRAYIMANMVEAEEPKAKQVRRRPGARSRRHLRAVHDGER
jgi:excisionase family DNA binding protein